MINFKKLIIPTAFAVPIFGFANPSITLQQNKSYGVWGSPISGVTSGVSPANYVVMAFIEIPGLGWYSKPTDAQPYLTLNPDGSYSGPLDSGGIDDFSTITEVYLVPANSPVVSTHIDGAGEVPATVKAAAVASDRGISPGQRTIIWSGIQWYAKGSNEAQVGPGSNIFSSATNSVYVDSAGYLHLFIEKDSQGNWCCPELQSANRLGYGTYTLNIADRANNLDPAATLGFFTWSDFSTDSANSELDIEYGKWNNPTNPWNAQYVVQPYTISSNLYRFVDSSVTASAQSIYWQPTRVGFSSDETPTFPINCWSYRGSSLPHSSSERVHINLWLNQSSTGNIPGPNNKSNVEVVLRSFQFTPYFVRPLYTWGSSPTLDAAAKQNYELYTFQFGGRVVSTSTTGLEMLVQAYGKLGPTTLSVLDPGQTFSVGQNVTAQGALTASGALDTSTGRILPQ